MEKLKVLVVDDDREIVDSIAIFLRADGEDADDRQYDPDRGDQHRRHDRLVLHLYVAGRHECGSTQCGGCQNGTAI